MNTRKTSLSYDGLLVSGIARLGPRAFRLAIVGLAWSAVVLLAQTPEVRVALAEVRTLAGWPQYVTVSSDGTIVVFGQFAGNEGDPFNNLLVLGSDGHVLKRQWAWTWPSALLCMKYETRFLKGRKGCAWLFQNSNTTA